MKNRTAPAAAVVLLLLGFLVPDLRGQGIDPRRAQATRAELEAALVELAKIAESSGYSMSLRRAKQAEAAAIRSRLTEGDFQVGDQIEVAVFGEQELTGRFTILPGRTIGFPNLPPVSLNGVLRSEAPAYLTREIGRYVRNPQVVIQASYIRLAVVGAVPRPGYYNIPADRLMSDAIMEAGGLTPGTDMRKTLVRRGNSEFLVADQVREALAAGMSLDQLNLNGGDEIVVGGSDNAALTAAGGGGIMRWLLPIQAVIGVVFIGTQIIR